MNSSALSLNLMLMFRLGVNQNKPLTMFQLTVDIISIILQEEKYQKLSGKVEIKQKSNKIHLPSFTLFYKFETWTQAQCRGLISI